MGFKYREILSEIIFAYVAGKPDISYAVEELSKFADNLAECHYVAIKRVVSYLRQDQEKGNFWWMKEPKTTLPVVTIIPKMDMDTQIPGAIITCEGVTYIDR